MIFLCSLPRKLKGLLEGSEGSISQRMRSRLHIYLTNHQKNVSLDSIIQFSQVATFIQPRHVYAPDEGEGHIYLSAPLVTVMARLKAAGVSEEMIHRDENLTEFADQTSPIEDDLILVNAVGAPYIEKLRGIVSRARTGATVVLGGQIIGSLGDDFDRIFTTVRSDVTVVNGMRAGVLEEIFKVASIPEQESVSSIPIWETFGEEKMRAYLEHSMAFYLSQGCKHACTFCQAQKNRPEVYRDMNHAIEEIRWLIQKAKSLGINTLEIYFSNLDFFQNPEKLAPFLDEVIQIRDELQFDLRFTALATVDDVKPELLAKAKEAGLVSVGVGIDGATPAVWRKTGKVQNLSAEGHEKAEKCINSIKKLHETGITPEILMVFGHDTGDAKANEEDLRTALSFAQDMTAQFGAVPRPHVVKNLVPGAEDWKKRRTYGETIELLLSHPELFQALDYTALASEVSHPDPELRALVNHYYIRMCALSQRSTKFVHPNTPEHQERAAERGTTVKALNEGMYDR